MRQSIDELMKQANEYNVCFMKKSDSILMILCSWMLAIFGMRKEFMNCFWTTIGRTIYYTGDESMLRSPVVAGVIAHELVHVRQWVRYGIFHPISYLMLPVPFLFAWFRWRWEREAYLVSIRDYGYPVDRAVEVLWLSYAWTWPRVWMMKWFTENVEMGSDRGK